MNGIRWALAWIATAANDTGGWLSAGSVDPCPLNDIVDFYEKTMGAAYHELANDKFWRGLYLRGHLPTLLDYARRVETVAEMGVAQGWSGVAFARAALEAASSDRAYRYWMYDIVRAPGVEKISPFVSNCSRIDFRFHEGDVLNAAFLQQLGHEAGPFPTTDLLFIDTTHTREQLLRELEAFAPHVTSYIVLHDTETFGFRDETVHNEGTEASYRRKQQLLRDEQVRQLQAAMWEQGAESLKDLDVASAHAALEEAQRAMDAASGLQNALRAWLHGSGGQWEILEHSLLDNGLTVLGRKQGRADNSSELCRQRMGQIRELAPELLELAPRFPTNADLAAAVLLTPRTAAEMARHLRAARWLCPGHLEVRAAQQVMATVAGTTAAPLVVAKADLRFAKRNPDLFLATLMKHRKLLERSDLSDLLGDALQLWPWRWELLVLAAGHATGHATALHRWRRAAALAQRNRCVAAAALEALEALGHGEEAKTIRGGDAPLWDVTQRPSPVLLSPTAAELPAEFQQAKALVELHLPSLGTEMRRADGDAPVFPERCDATSCEQILFEYSSCRFISRCQQLPQLCRTLRDLEDLGLAIVAAATVAAATDFSVHVAATAVPGRIQLWCPLVKLQVIHNSEAVVTADSSCFWFDEASAASSLKFSGQRMQFLRLDVIHPAYYAEDSLLEISGEALSLLWFQGRLGSLGSTGALAAQVAATFAARSSWGRPWLHFARQLRGHVAVELCGLQLGRPLAQALQRNDFDEAKRLLQI